jgi:16S rRNA (guanine527-N7)-methyltransferase
MKNLKFINIKKEIYLSDKAIRDALRPFGVIADSELIARVRLYIETLLVWNQKVNLTSLTQPKEILRRHFGESFFAATALNITKGRLADVGSGAGFPGLALKLLEPEKIQLTMVEPNLKKATFLGEIVSKLGLVKIQIIRSRYEQIRPSDLRVQWITARAIGSYPRLLSWARDILENGYVVLWVSGKTVEEINTVPNWCFSSPILIPESKDRYIVWGKPK